MVTALSFFVSVGYLLGTPALSGVLSKDMSFAFQQMNNDINIAATRVSIQMSSVNTQQALTAFRPSQAMVQHIDRGLNVALR